MSSKFSRNSEQVFCRCGLPAVLLTSHHPHSYGRRFYRCPRWANGPDRRQSFRWADSSTYSTSHSDGGSTISHAQSVAQGSTSSQPKNVAPDMPLLHFKMNIIIILVVILLCLLVFNRSVDSHY